MYSIEQFQNLPKSIGGQILTVEEFKAQPGPQVVEITEVLIGNRKPARLYVTNHCYGTGLLPDAFVSCSIMLPRHVRPRDGFEDGWIKTPEDQHRFEVQCDRVYHTPHSQIESLEQLVDYLNEHYGDPA